ncbi:hypothetical protein ACLMJK_006390 [Lecanora helva]
MAYGPGANGRPSNAQNDFKGNLKVNNNPPDKEQLEKVADLPVLDANKKSRTFKSLYADDENGPRRVLVVFIRHFFCGNCQDYLRTLASEIPSSDLASLSPPTSIVVIGCGQPELIPMYYRQTDCPFPIYADPTRKLYDMLGMTKTLSLGPSAPDYMRRSVFSMAVSSFLQEMRSGRKMLSGGDYRQVGGEFVFSGGKVTFCKRMRNTRDHAEVPEVRKHLGLDRAANATTDEEKPAFARKRWSTSGLGAGIGRRLSSRRRSWAPSRSMIENQEARGISPKKDLQELKEEEVTANGSATPEDALAKLEGRGPTEEHGAEEPPIHESANDTADGTTLETAHGTANGTTPEAKLLNGAIANGSANGHLMNGTANGHITA